MSVGVIIMGLLYWLTVHLSDKQHERDIDLINARHNSEQWKVANNLAKICNATNLPYEDKWVIIEEAFRGTKFEGEIREFEIEDQLHKILNND